MRLSKPSVLKASRLYFPLRRISQFYYVKSYSKAGESCKLQALSCKMVLKLEACSDSRGLQLCLTISVECLVRMGTEDSHSSLMVCQVSLILPVFLFLKKSENIARRNFATR